VFGGITHDRHADPRRVFVSASSPHLTSSSSTELT
jgi:hypothetical protein